MKISNPIILLILIVCINALITSAICLSAREQVSQLEERSKILILGAFGFLSTASLAVILGYRLIGAFVEPAEISASKMLAVSGRADTDLEDGGKELPELTDMLVGELETSRQRERLIADYASDILCCLDEERRFLDLNLQSESILKFPIMSLLATPLDTIIHADDKDEYLNYFLAAKSEPQARPLECRVLTGDVRLIDLEWQVEWSPSSKHFYCLAKDISDRKENQRLRAEITAMVGHDLRAPVSSFSFLLDNLSSGTFGKMPEEAADKIEKARDSVAHMLNLINQLLDAEKLECGQMAVDLKIIPLSEVYESCCDLLNDLAAKQNVKIKFPENSSAMVMADFDRSVQILCNLLSNAIKWSPADSTVSVSERVDPRFVMVHVTDKGPGISRERQQVIFDRFKSLDDRKDKSMASSGLGLYIAKKLCELQGGTIALKSAPGEGSTFSFSMRKACETDMPGYLKA